MVTRYSSPKWASELSAALPPSGLDVVLDGSGGEAINTYIRLIGMGQSAGRCPLPALHCPFPALHCTALRCTCMALDGAVLRL